MLKKNIFSIIVALLIMYLSLTSSDTFDNVPLFGITNLDKIVHFMMYFGLMSVIIFEHRKRLNTIGTLFLTALIPLFYGLLMEILQALFTATRSGSFYDALFNTAGILASLLLWLIVKPLLKDNFR